MPGALRGTPLALEPPPRPRGVRGARPSEDSGMTTRIRLLAAAVAAAALAGPAAAQTDVRQRTTTTTTTTEVRKASVVMNANVVVEGGATVGKVTDFVL